MMLATVRQRTHGKGWAALWVPFVFLMAVPSAAAQGSGPNSITLRWTAPGDDGNSGRASWYDIRYSTQLITEADWNSARQAIGEPRPKAAGSLETFTVTGLRPSTMYYFVMRTADEVPNWSGLSNNAVRTTDPPTDVVDIDSPELPTSFVLEQNFPNPFNAETRIKFSLPRSCFVTVEIYNILGERVTTLARRRLSAGHKSVTWDGEDDLGNSVSSGVYFFRLNAGDFHDTKKMVLLK